MAITLPSVSKQLTEDQVFQAITKNYYPLIKTWSSFQVEWMHGSYLTFKDHEKFMIVQYLVYKTLNFFSINLIKLDFETYYSKNQLEIANFNVISIARDLEISKETARRKILELQKLGVIIRDKKKIILNRDAFKFQKPNQSIFNTAFLLSKFTETLLSTGDIDKKFTSENIQMHMKKNFTHCWKLFYEMQIPYVLNWKRFLGDYETWHIWGIITTQKAFADKVDKNKANKKINHIKYLQSAFKGNSYGINAMSISDLSGIPRATVVRKINYLLKKKLIKIDKNKLYSSTAGKPDMKKIIEINNSSMSLLANFFCKTINLIQAN